MRNIYDILSKIDFGKHCEQYALGFQRDTDTPTMTRFRQASMREFCFSLIQKFYEIVLQDHWKEITAVESKLHRTRKALDVAKDKLDTIRQYHRGTAVIRPDDIAAYCDRAIEQIIALEQKE